MAFASAESGEHPLLILVTVTPDISDNINRVSGKKPVPVVHLWHFRPKHFYVISLTSTIVTDAEVCLLTLSAVKHGQARKPSSKPEGFWLCSVGLWVAQLCIPLELLCVECSYFTFRNKSSISRAIFRVEITGLVGKDFIKYLLYLEAFLLAHACWKKKKKSIKICSLFCLYSKTVENCVQIIKRKYRAMYSVYCCAYFDHEKLPVKHERFFSWHFVRHNMTQQCSVAPNNLYGAGLNKWTIILCF